MLDSNPFLNNLRSKPPRTRMIIAVFAALIPTLAVSYAQFYMRARATDQQVAAVGAASGTQDVSIFEAVGKIFEEGKSTVSKSVDTLKQINTSVLDSAPISASSSDSGSSDSKLDLGAIPGNTASDATVTKTFTN